MLARFRRVHALAAALTLVGAAGLVFVAFSLLSGPATEAASDDPLLFSVGDVPKPVGTPSENGASAQPGDELPQVPDAASQPTAANDIDASPDGSFNKGGDVQLNEPLATPLPAPTAGTSQSGVRSNQAQGFEPTDIRIPAIDLAARVVPVGTTSYGAMEAPRRYSEIGWWSPGARPGDSGRAVMAGHVDSPWGAAVFINLDKLEPGDEIIVGNGLEELRFVVRGAAVYRADAAPVEDIFGPSSEQELVLITCGGWFDRNTASYLHRRVIFAVLADPDDTPSAAGQPSE